MKNLLKKLGVIGLIVAMLLPFVELPVVNAATEGCTDHTLQQYYFLDVFEGARGIGSYEDGRTTATMFAYLFPETNGKKINILNVSVDNLNDEDDTKQYLKNYWDEMTHLGGDYTYERKSSIGKVGSFNTDKNYDETYYTSILHGLWGECTTSDCRATQLKKSAGWFDGSASEFYKSSIQKLLDYQVDDSNVEIVGGRFNSSKSISGVRSDKYKDLVSYFEAVANRTDDELITTYENNEYLGLRITRELSTSELDGIVYGAECGTSDRDSNGEVTFARAKCDNNTSNKKYIHLSYENFSKYNDYGDANAIPGTLSNTKPDLDINDIKYWPVILNVEYEVCPTSSSPEKGQWTLKYDENTDDTSVTNMPSAQIRDENTDITVDSKTPSRSGYTFKGWNTKSDGSGDSYKANDTFKYPGAGTYTLFAQWGKSGSEDNKKTGVISYVIGFISTGIVAGGIYLLAKKKNLFKQI